MVDVVAPPPLGWVLAGVLAVVDEVVPEPDPDRELEPDEPPVVVAVDPADFPFVFVLALGTVVVVVPVDVPGGGVPRICSACWISVSIAAMSDWYVARSPAISAVCALV